MSYDGISGNVDNTFEVPKRLYDEHVYIKSGNSSFKRIIGKSNDRGLFVNYPQAKDLWACHKTFRSLTIG